MPSHVLSVLFQILFYSTQWLYTKIIFSREKAIKTWYSLLNKYHISSCPGRNAVCCPQNHKSGHAQWPSTAI